VGNIGHSTFNIEWRKGAASCVKALASRSRPKPAKAGTPNVFSRVPHSLKSGNGDTPSLPKTSRRAGEDEDDLSKRDKP
jgi:hypothetical protein